MHSFRYHFHLTRPWRVDHTALDPSHAGYDRKFAAKHEEAITRGGEVVAPEPKWFMVDVKFERELRRPVSLTELREAAEGGEALKDMVLLRRSRLSVQPVSRGEWAHVMRLEQQAERDR